MLKEGGVIWSRKNRIETQRNNKKIGKNQIVDEEFPLIC